MWGASFIFLRVLAPVLGATTTAGLREISGGWRTVPGAERFFTLRGYLFTATKQGKDLLDAITRLFDGVPGSPHQPDHQTSHPCP